MENLIKNIKSNYKLIIVVFVLGVLIGVIIRRPLRKEEVNTLAHEHQNTEKDQIWTCSMHPQIRMDKPGKCPICSMDLIPLESGNSSKINMNPNEIQMSEEAIKLAEIQTMIVKKDYANKEVYLLGKVKPDERNIAELTARFGGRIEKLFVNFTGQNVTKGDKLATIYSPELVTAQKELLESIAYKETNPAFYKAARNKLKLWDLTGSQINGIEQKGEIQNYFNVLSPISGTVTIRHVSIGNYIKEGNALFQVIDLTKVWVLFDAYESDLPWLQTGDKVEFTVQSLPGEKFTGNVTFIDPFLNPKTRVANVRIELQNPNLKLKPEMFANGIIKPKISANQKNLLIPKTSVLWTGKRAVVYVKIPERETATFLYREIVLGPEAGEFYIVKSGLQEGEEIAVNGVFKIDAAAQLEGKTSMMNPTAVGGKIPSVHNHGDMKIKSKSEYNNRNEHANLEQAMFKVSGNCEMCKTRIEEAANSVDGVSNAKWDQKSQIIEVSFDTAETDLNKIGLAIAKIGHDNDLHKTDDKTYNALPGCCKYKRNK